MLREYEFTVIARTDIPEADRAKLFEKYEQMLTADGGEFILRNEWGSRKLTFPINEQFRGHYINYDFVGKPEHLSEVERLMRIDEGILRFMSVRIGENVDVNERRAELAKSEAEERLRMEAETR